MWVFKGSGLLCSQHTRKTNRSFGSQHFCDLCLQLSIRTHWETVDILNRFVYNCSCRVARAVYICVCKLILSESDTVSHCVHMTTNMRRSVKFTSCSHPHHHLPHQEICASSVLFGPPLLLLNPSSQWTLSLLAWFSPSFTLNVSYSACVELHS